jgi:hypothetical protein
LRTVRLDRAVFSAAFASGRSCQPACRWAAFVPHGCWYRIDFAHDRPASTAPVPIGSAGYWHQSQVGDGNAVADWPGDAPGMGLRRHLTDIAKNLPFSGTDALAAGKLS